MVQVEFQRHGCKAFFKKYRAQRQQIRQWVKQALEQEITTGMSKCKVASKRRIDGQSVYECRLNLGTIGSARIAFTLTTDQATVYFITTHLQKSVFSREV